MIYKIDNLDYSSRESILNIFKNVFHISENDIINLCKTHERKDEYWYKLFEDKFKIKIDEIIISEVTLHHVTNIFNIDEIKGDGLRSLRHLLLYESCLKSFLNHNKIIINFDEKKVFYKDKEIMIDSVFNVMNRLNSEPYIHCFLFKEDIYYDNNYYTDKIKGILRKTPEIISELDKALGIGLVKSWISKNGQPYIISFKIKTDLIKSWDIKWIINDILEHLCLGRSEYENNIELKNIDLINQQYFINIEQL